MIAEVVIVTGWTVEHILKMNSRRFFKMRDKLLEIDLKRHHWMLREMCDVAFIAQSDINYIDKLKEFYSRSLDKNHIRTRETPLDLNDPVMMEVFKAPFIQKMRLMGLQ